MRVSVLLLAVLLLPSAALSLEVRTDGESRLSQDDPRLDRIVNYDGGYARLHAAIDDLSKLTGVQIRCGATRSDWQVRDIPVIVCARDISLRQLLRAITAATHTQLSSYKPDPEKPLIYRIRRSDKLEASIPLAEDAKARACKETTAWTWDTLAAFAGMKNPKVTLPPRGPGNSWGVDIEQIRAVGGFLASLDSETRERVLAGEQIVLRMSDCPQPQAARTLVRYGYDVWRRAVGSSPTMEILPLDDERINSCSVAMKRGTTIGSSGAEGLILRVGGLPSLLVSGDERLPDSGAWHANTVEAARLLSLDSSLGFAARPSLDGLDGLDETPAGFGALASVDDWKTPVLQAKVTLTAPKVKTLQTRAEMLRELSRATGCTIVCEDFVSHAKPYRHLLDTSSVTDVTSAEALRKLESKFAAGYQRMCGSQWFLDEDQKILLGCARDWRTRHLNLAPESMLTSVRLKLNSRAGAGLDDLVPLLTLSRGQFGEWVVGSDDLEEFGRSFQYGYMPLFAWKLYASVPESHRALAATEGGLDLSILGPEWMRSTLAWIRADLDLRLRLTGGPRSETLTFLTLPDDAEHVVLRLTTHPGSGQKEKSTYTLKVDWEARGEKDSKIQEWPAMPLPLFSKQNEAGTFRNQER